MQGRSRGLRTARWHTRSCEQLMKSHGRDACSSAERGAAENQSPCSSKTKNLLAREGGGEAGCQTK